MNENEDHEFTEDCLDQFCGNVRFFFFNTLVLSHGLTSAPSPQMLRLL